MDEESDLMRTAREAGERLARDAAGWSLARRDYFERSTGMSLSPLSAGGEAARPGPAPAPDPAGVEAVLAKVVEVSRVGTGAGLIERLDGVYAERTLLILALCSLFPSGLKKAPVRGMPREFETAVYVDTPAGQLSWHLHEDDLPTFAHLPEYHGGWDGHSTAEKYRRLTSAAFADTEERAALRFYANGFEYAGQDDNVSPEPTDALCEDAGRRAMEALSHRLSRHPDGREAALEEFGRSTDELTSKPGRP